MSRPQCRAHRHVRSLPRLSRLKPDIASQIPTSWRDSPWSTILTVRRSRACVPDRSRENLQRLPVLAEAARSGIEGAGGKSATTTPGPRPFASPGSPDQVQPIGSRLQA